jgi:hypothetical protein
MGLPALPTALARRVATAAFAAGLAGCVVAKLGAAAKAVETPDAEAVADGGDGAASLNDATLQNDTSPETADVTVQTQANDDGMAPDAPVGGPVSFSIDVAGGPARQVQPPASPSPISPAIYGVNGSSAWGATLSLSNKTRWGLIRKGGNPFTTWNWTNNYFDVGATACFAQRQAGGAGALAGAVTADGNSISAAQAIGAPYLVTVPIVDSVSAAHVNDTLATCPTTTTIDCDGGPETPTDVNSNSLDFATTDPASAAFVRNLPTRPGGDCGCPPGLPCDAGCTISTSPVYQDELVSYLKATFGAGPTPIFFSLDNEPNYWGGVHPEIWPFSGTLPCQTSFVSYDDIVGRDELYAKAIKAAWPSAEVFGPVVSQDGLIYAHSYEHDPHFPTEFLDYYLAQMSAASADAGQPLLDVLDVHYYNQGTSAPEQCVQNPRMFWDPNYTALPAAQTDFVDFASAGIDGYFDLHWYPRQIIPRLERKISVAYPPGGAAAPGLSFSEYNSGCETTIAGAIAEADDLGIFGREGVYAAAVMPLAVPEYNYLLAAFDLYRNYDGQSSVVGDLAIAATTSDVDRSSVYAFAASKDPSALDVVAINKTAESVLARIAIAHAPSLSSASAYAIVDGNAAVVPVTGPSAPTVTCAGGTCSLEYTMAPLSATTIALH